MTLVVPPRIGGTTVVAEILGINRYTVYDRLERADPVVMLGYLGKPSGRHAWNITVMIGALFPGEADLMLEVARARSKEPTPGGCTIEDCHRPVVMVQLCDFHLRKLMHVLASERQGILATAQLVAMCRWVVDRNDHLVLPDGYDGFSDLCMTCQEPVSTDGQWYGPLCPPCCRKFWNNPEIRRSTSWPQRRNPAGSRASSPTMMPSQQAS